MINEEIGFTVSEYKEEWQGKVTELGKINHSALPEIGVRNEQVNTLIEEYREHVGENPSSYWLTHLGTYILNEDLKQNDKDKMSKNEYPLLSHRQEYRRRRSQTTVGDDKLDYLNSKFVLKMDSLHKKPSLSKVQQEDEY